MAQLTNGTHGSSPAMHYYLSAEQIYAAGNERGVQVTIELKVYGSTGSSKYGYPLRWRPIVDGNYGSWEYVKGTEYWYATNGWRSYSQNVYINVGTTSSKSVSVAFEIDRSDGGSSSWEGTISSSFTVSATNTKPWFPPNPVLILRNGSANDEIITGIIPENTSKIYCNWTGVRDNESGVTHILERKVNNGDWPTIYRGSGVEYIDDIGVGNAGSTYQYWASGYDDKGEYPSDPYGVYSAVLTKNSLTGASITEGNSVSFDTSEITLKWSGAKNTNENTEFTYDLLCNEVSIYNSQNLAGSGVAIKIYKSGTIPTTPYIKFEDIKSKFLSNNYQGTFNFTLKTYNKYGSVKTSSKSISVDLRTNPNPASNVIISESESTAFRTHAATKNKYCIPDRNSFLKVKWNAGSDKLGKSVTYTIDAKFGNEPYVNVSNGITSTSYDYYVPKQNKKVDLKIKITTVTNFGYSSSAEMLIPTAIHYWDEPSISVGNINRTDSTAEIPITVNTSTSIPNVNTKGHWSCNDKSGNLLPQQYEQKINLTGLLSKDIYNVNISYNDDTGFMTANKTIKVTVPANKPMFVINKYGIGVAGEIPTNELPFISGGNAHINGKLTINDNLEITGSLNTKKNATIGGTLTSASGLKVTSSSITYKGNNIYHSGNKPTAEDVGARPNTWMPTAEDVGALGIYGELGDGKDLNNYKDNGVWFQQYDSSARTGTNYPIARAGVLVVKSNPTKTLIFQSYRTYGPFDETYTRTYHTDYGWLPWKYEGSGTVEGDGYSLMRVGKLIFVSGWNTVFSGEESSKKVWYPTTFPTKTLAVTITQQWVQGCNGNGYDMVITALDNDGFWMNPAANVGRRVHWIAIGH